MSECGHGLQRIAFAPTPSGGESSRSSWNRIERHAPHSAGEWEDLLARNPRLTALGVIIAIFLVLVIAKGLHDVAQTGPQRAVARRDLRPRRGRADARHGILKLVNFAQGDFLTFGAYMAYLVNVTWGAPLVVAIFWAMLMTALLGSSSTGCSGRRCERSTPACSSSC